MSNEITEHLNKAKALLIEKYSNSIDNEASQEALKNINKDFETAYQQSIWKGLDLKQLITVGCFLPTVIGIMVALWYFLNVPPQGGVYIGILAALPIPFLGLFKYRGMSIPMLCKEWKYLQKTKKLCGETETEAGQKHRVFTMHPSRKER